MKDGIIPNLLYEIESGIDRPMKIGIKVIVKLKANWIYRKGPYSK